MNKILRSLRMSFSALLNSRLFFLLLAPPVFAFAAIFILFFIFWSTWTTGLGAYLSGLWILQWTQSIPDVGHWLAVVFLVLLFVPLTYLVSVVLTSILVMPLVLAHLGRTTYRDLEKKRGGSTLGSAWNTLRVTALFLLYFVISLPLWLVPMGQVVMPLFLTSWLNKRVFMYDVLQDYASPEEARTILRKNSAPLYGLGFILSFMAYVPLAFFLVPVVSALSYSYYGLEELRRLRGSPGRG